VACAEPDGGGVDGDGIVGAGIDGEADGSGSDGSGGRLAVGRGRLGRGRLGSGRLGRGSVGSGRLGSGGGNVGSSSLTVEAGRVGRIESFNGQAPETGATTTTVRSDPSNQPAAASLEVVNAVRVRRDWLSIDWSGMADIQPTGL
jgi:hypothetical protein